MASGFVTAYGGYSAGIDLDDLFEPGGGIGQNTGFYSTARAQDLGALYAPLAAGSSVGFNTGFVALNGQDLANLFARKGSVITDYWVGTITVGVGGANQFFGVYWTGSQFYWGSYTKTGGSSTLYGLQYEPGYSAGARTWIAVNDGSALPGDPAYIRCECGGASTAFVRESAGNYWATGDIFNLAGKVGQVLSTRIYPY